MIIFDKDYSGESLNDLGRDIDEAFDPMFNPIVRSLVTDENGFVSGSFKVVVYYQDDEEDGK